MASVTFPSWSSVSFTEDLTSFSYTEEKIESCERGPHVFLRTEMMTQTEKMQVVVGQAY